MLSYGIAGEIIWDVKNNLNCMLCFNNWVPILLLGGMYDLLSNKQNVSD